MKSFEFLTNPVFDNFRPDFSNDKFLFFNQLLDIFFVKNFIIQCHLTISSSIGKPQQLKNNLSTQ